MIYSIQGFLKIDKNTSGKQALFYVSLNSFDNINDIAKDMCKDHAIYCWRETKFTLTSFIETTG